MRWRCVLALGFAIAVGPVARAADWPTRPVRIVAPSTPGGAADLFGRLMADHLSEILKERFYVDNRAGGGGLIGAQITARAEPDGYTFVTSSIAYHAIAPAASPNPGFDPIRDFTHIAYIGGPPIVLVVPPSSELRSLDDVIAAAKADKFSGYASSGVGTLGHLVVEYVAKRHNLKLTHIPYNTAAFADIIAGRVPMGSFTWGAALGQIQGGTLRALAVTTEARRPEAPNVPTFKELGYDLVASTWFSFSGPKGLPKEIVQRLNQETIRILELPEVKKRVIQDAFDPKPLTPEQLAAFMAAETARWTPIAQAAMKKQ